MHQMVARPPNLMPGYPRVLPQGLRGAFAGGFADHRHQVKDDQLQFPVGAEPLKTRAAQGRDDSWA